MMHALIFMSGFEGPVIMKMVRGLRPAYRSLTTS